MPTQQKITTVAELKTQVEQASALYFIDFTKVSANDINMVRRRLDELKVTMKVVKNRLAARALAETGVPDGVEQILVGPTSVVFAAEDPVAPARLIREIAVKLKDLRVKGAFLDGAIYAAEQFEFLASLPTKADLQAQLVGVLQGPISEFAFSLEGLISELVRVLDEIKDRPAAEPAAQ
jgi:large subunit ribosomal protein L10